MLDSSHAVPERIRAELAKRGWSQRTLGDQTLLSEATIFRLLQGNYTTKTLRKVEQALEMQDSLTGLPTDDVADTKYGGYLRELFAYYEGDYVLVRPAFSEPDKFCVYGVRIEWSKELRGLTFIDRNPGYRQQGVLAIPRGTQFVHFLTFDTGSMRLMTAYHMPPSWHTMHGLSLTFANPRGRTLYPAAVRFVMRRLDSDRDPFANEAGLIDRSDQRLARFGKHFASSSAEMLVVEE